MQQTRTISLITRLEGPQVKVEASPASTVRLVVCAHILLVCFFFLFFFVCVYHTFLLVLFFSFFLFVFAPPAVAAANGR